MEDAIWLTARLSAVTTIILILLSTPLAWWLSRRGSWLREAVAALAAMPIVLPPTVLGFYLLVALGPQSPLMAPLHLIGVRTLAFTFWGLVIGSVFYSLPFAVQPLRAAFEAIGERPLEAAATLRATPLDAFLSVELPLARRGFLTAAILVFAHTVGEFGVVLTDDVPVAVAANFTEPVKEIAAAFTAKTGHHLVLSFGSSGQFYTQITQGAPFQVFLSADADRPQRLEREGLGVPGARFTYAVGRLVLYSRTPGLVDARGAVLSRGAFHKIAIADPAAAPYGAAAMQAMTKLGVWRRLQPKIVKGSSITQTYQFVESGAAELGFIALSQVVGRTGGSRWLAPATLHAPIDQQAILLFAGEKKPAARAFLQFLKSPEALAIIKRYGYEVR